jgi:hypothetical protein
VFFFALPAFVAMYVLTAIMQESLLVAAGMRVEQTWPSPDNERHESECVEKEQGSEAETEGRVL